MTYLCVDCGQPLQKKRNYKITRCKDCVGVKKWKIQQPRAVVAETLSLKEEEELSKEEFIQRMRTKWKGHPELD